MKMCFAGGPRLTARTVKTDHFCLLMCRCLLSFDFISMKRNRCQNANWITATKLEFVSLNQFLNLLDKFIESIDQCRKSTDQFIKSSNSLICRSAGLLFNQFNKSTDQLPPNSWSLSWSLYYNGKLNLNNIRFIQGFLWLL